jgi:hypothetical protein
MPVGISLGGHPVDLPQLQDELAVAGIVVGALGVADDYVFSYDGDGVPIGLPPGSDAVVAAHVPDTTLAGLLSTVLTPTVGIVFGSLTTDQKLGLIFGLLYRAGALDGATAQVLPLADWLLTS